MSYNSPYENCVRVCVCVFADGWKVEGAVSCAGEGLMMPEQGGASCTAQHSKQGACKAS
jgi:hypothetical protein